MLKDKITGLTQSSKESQLQLQDVQVCSLSAFHPPTLIKPLIGIVARRSEARLYLGRASQESQ